MTPKTKPADKAAKKSRKRKQAKVEPVSSLFQVQLYDTKLSGKQAERVAARIRKATRRELLKMDFRIEELAPLFRDGPGGLEVGSCGGACHSCSSCSA